MENWNRAQKRGKEKERVMRWSVLAPSGALGGDGDGDGKALLAEPIYRPAMVVQRHRDPFMAVGIFSPFAHVLEFKWRCSGHCDSASLSMLGRGALDSAMAVATVEWAHSAACRGEQRERERWGHEAFGRPRAYPFRQWRGGGSGVEAPTATWYSCRLRRVVDEAGKRAPCVGE